MHATPYDESILELIANANKKITPTPVWPGVGFNRNGCDVQSLGPVHPARNHSRPTSCGGSADALRPNEAKPSPSRGQRGGLGDERLLLGRTGGDQVVTALGWSGWSVRL